MHIYSSAQQILSTTKPTICQDWISSDLISSLSLISYADLPAYFHPPPPFSDWSHSLSVLCRPTDRPVPDSRKWRCSCNSVFISCSKTISPWLEKSGSVLSKHFARKGSLQLWNVTAQAVGGLDWHYTHTHAQVFLLTSKVFILS